MINKEQSSRNISLDIAKAICISLMVIGHSGCPDYLNRFIYMFHMPCFFFISGCLLKETYVDNLKTGIFRKAKGSYWPFVKWTIIFIALHNMFTYCHIYSDGYSLKQTLEKLLRAITMTGSEQLLGGFWFLISLFWASIFSLLYLGALKKFGRLTLIYKLGGVILALLCACLFYLLPINLPSMFHEKTIMATAFYMSGFVFKDIVWFKKKWAMTLIAIPAIVAVFTRISLDATGVMCLIYFLISFAGIIGVVAASNFIAESRISAIFAIVGKTTLYILIFHFLSFKIVSYLYIVANGMPIELLSQFPVLKVESSWLWIAYSIVGVALPMAFWKLSRIKLSK